MTEMERAYEEQLGDRARRADAVVMAAARWRDTRRAVRATTTQAERELEAAVDAWRQA